MVRQLIEAYFSLVLVAVLLLGSPGPAPLAIAATGAVFGFRQGLWFLLGLVAGFALVLIIQGLGLAALLSTYPGLERGLQLFGLLYIMYVAYKIATAPITDDTSLSGTAPSFFDGVVLNVTNPKAYATLMAINAQFLLPYQHQAWAYVMTGLVCFIVVLLVDSLWLLLGKALRPLIHSATSGRVIRIVFAVLMVGAVLWVLLKNI